MVVGPQTERVDLRAAECNALVAFHDGNAVEFRLHMSEVRRLRDNLDTPWPLPPTLHASFEDPGATPDECRRRAIANAVDVLRMLVAEQVAKTTRRASDAKLRDDKRAAWSAVRELADIQARWGEHMPPLDPCEGDTPLEAERAARDARTDDEHTAAALRLAELTQ